MDSQKLFHKQKFSIKVLSPVHVGTGVEFVQGLDYYTSSEATLFLHSEKISSKYVNDPAYVDAIVNNKTLDYLKQNNAKLSDFIRHEIKGSAKAPTIRELTSDVFGEPYLPGSSIKGALRTAIFQNMLANEPRQLEKLGSFQEAKYLESNLLSSDKTGKKKPNYDIGRAIRIPDVHFAKDDLVIVNAKVLNRGRDYEITWKDLASRRNESNFERGTDLSVVALATDSVSTQHDWSLDHNILSSIRMGGKGADSWLDIAKAANTFAERLAKHHLNYVDTFSGETEETDQIAGFYEDEIIHIGLNYCREQIEKGKPAFLLQVGWGTGWNAKTGFTEDEHIDTIRKNFNRLGRSGVEEFPKTRKVVKEYFEDEPLAGAFGWIMISQMD